MIMVILLLLLFIVGPPYLDPPEEYGVAVNFGTNDFGSGNRPLSRPKQADIPKKVEAPKPKQEKVEPVKTPVKSESKKKLRPKQKQKPKELNA